MDLIPNCLCGNGKMTLKCAGPEAQNAGRWYYKCPARLKHDGHFHWCDEYHDKLPEHIKPHYVIHQDYKRVEPSQGSYSTTKAVKNRANSPPLRCSGCLNDFGVVIAFLFMAIVIFLFGIVIGKLL